MNQKRVLNLYRVSTKMQVKENDIPMQKAECTKYISLHPDWILCGERFEKGISGFKYTSKSRDVLNEIMELAHRGEFDILLVYMSDRLGRREDDTPLYVAELNRLGIEVWSVNEGQLKTQEHIDKLMNYIRFWNAEGESLKTSVRVRDAQLEMLKRGEYTGGGCPYGYRHVYSGKYNSKGRALKKLEIHPDEMEIVQKIYDLSTNQGMGGYRIAQTLNSEGIKTKKASKWTLCTVNNILRNPIYKGYYSYGKGKTQGKRGNTTPDRWVLSEVQNPELVIIPEDDWNRAQKIRESRTPANHRKENREYDPLSCTGGKLLLLGFAYCGYCGARLSNGTAYDKWVTKDRVTHKKRRGQYKCTAKSEGSVSCPGKTNYRQEPLEDTVLEALYSYVDKLSFPDIHTKLTKAREELRQKEEKKLEILQTKVKTLEKDLLTLKDQLPLAIRQEFVLSSQELQELIGTKKRQLEETKNALIMERLRFSAQSIQKPELPQDRLPSLRDAFLALSLAEKRRFLSVCIDGIHVKKEEIEIRMKIRLDDDLPPISNSDVSTSHCMV